MPSTDLSRRAFVAALTAIGAISSSAVTSAAQIPAEPSTAFDSALRSTPGRKSSRSLFSVRSSDGVELSAESQGISGAPEILFVHGIRQSGLIWERQFSDPVLSGYRLVRFDLRGHGDSDKPASLAAYSDIGQWGDDIAAVMAAAKLHRPVIVGWSLGGAILGGYLKARGGGTLAGINLVDAVTRPTTDFLTRLSGEFSRRTSSHDLAERSAATAEFVRACFEKPPRGREYDTLLAINGMTPRAVTEGLAKVKIDHDPAYRAFKGPLLVSHGLRDQLLRVTMAHHNVALHPGARLSLYSTAGHSPFYEDAPRFNRELAAFVAASLAK